MKHWPYKDMPDWFLDLFRRHVDEMEYGASYKQQAEKMWLDLHNLISPNQLYSQAEQAEMKRIEMVDDKVWATD